MTHLIPPNTFVWFTQKAEQGTKGPMNYIIAVPVRQVEAWSKLQGFKVNDVQVVKTVNTDEQQSQIN